MHDCLANGEDIQGSLAGGERIAECGRAQASDPRVAGELSSSSGRANRLQCFKSLTVQIATPGIAQLGIDRFADLVVAECVVRPGRGGLLAQQARQQQRVERGQGARLIQAGDPPQHVEACPMPEHRGRAEQAERLRSQSTEPRADHLAHAGRQHAAQLGLAAQRGFEIETGLRVQDAALDEHFERFRNEKRMALGFAEQPVAERVAVGIHGAGTAADPAQGVLEVKRTQREALEGQVTLDAAEPAGGCRVAHGQQQDQRTVQLGPAAGAVQEQVECGRIGPDADRRSAAPRVSLSESMHQSGDRFEQIARADAVRGPMRKIGIAVEHLGQEAA